jgi:hypothetical protein
MSILGACFGHIRTAFFDNRSLLRYSWCVEFEVVRFDIVGLNI